VPGGGGAREAGCAREEIFARWAGAVDARGERGGGAGGRGAPDIRGTAPAGGGLCEGGQGDCRANPGSERDPDGEAAWVLRVLAPDIPRVPRRSRAGADQEGNNARAEM